MSILCTAIERDRLAFACATRRESEMRRASAPAARPRGALACAVMAHLPTIRTQQLTVTGADALRTSGVGGHFWSLISAAAVTRTAAQRREPNSIPPVHINYWQCAANVRMRAGPNPTDALGRAPMRAARRADARRRWRRCARAQAEHLPCTNSHEHVECGHRHQSIIITRFAKCCRVRAAAHANKPPQQQRATKANQKQRMILRPVTIWNRCVQH